MKTKAPFPTLKKRAQLTKNPTAERLLHLIEEKESNLAVNIDVTKGEELLQMARRVAPSICILKTHVDILEDFSDNFRRELQALAEKENFLIFEDRKFADIGTIAKMQYEKGIYKIASWAHITNAHVLPGPGIIEGLKEAGMPLGRGLLLLAQMSSKGSLATGAYTEACVKMAEAHPDFVIGFIAQERMNDDPRLIHLTPGVKLSEGTDTLGQQYHTPESVIAKGSDVIIVGRGILHAKDPSAEAEKYRIAGINALRQQGALSS